MELKSAFEISRMVAGGKLSAVEAVNGALDRIRSAEGRINAFNSVFEEHALKRAETMDRKILAGENPGLLAGVPVAVKDNICIRGFKTTCSSKMLENYISPYDATVIGMLEKSGAIIVGKTNMDEFAMGSSTENSAFKKTRNPWNPDYIPGGSSGGSAAAVAAGIVPIALGSDTGGSIRQPASCCGIVGFKPTYGRVSRYGLVAFASSLDQIGSFTRDVEDCALALEIISGNDPKDSTSSAAPAEKYAEEMKKGIKGIKIGIPDEYFIPGMDPEVRDAVDKAVLALEKQGAVIERISLPHTEYAVAVYYIIAPCEASANLARYDGVRYGLRAPGDNLINVYGKTRGAGFGQEVKRRIMLGTYALSAGYYEAYYGKAQKVRTLIKGDFDKAFAKVDVIVTPTAPTAAFKIGEKTGNPLMMYLSDIFTIPCNLAGLPGVSLPCGFTGAGLPVGFQILGEPFGESLVLRAAFAYQSGTDWHKRTPEGLWN